MIELKGITKYYNSHPACVDINLTVPDGAIFAYLGPNGAGKTTTLKITAGILYPTAGKVFIEGIDLIKEPSKAKQYIAYIPDTPYMYPQLTGREFLYFVGRVYGMTKAEIEKKTEAVVEKLRIGDWVDEPASNYSHGMRQRVIFAASFIHSPKILIVDEPMVGLDPKGIKTVKDLLREHKRQGGSVLMSTHTLPLAQELATHIGIIHKGRIVLQGPVEQIPDLISEDIESFYLRITGGEE